MGAPLEICSKRSVVAVLASGVVISQFRTRTAASQYDEYVQVTNTTAAPVDLSGWQMYDCYTSGGKAAVGTDSDPLPSGTVLPAAAPLDAQTGPVRS